jgi:hypothetical protein
MTDSELLLDYFARTLDLKVAYDWIYRTKEETEVAEMSQEA